MSQLQSKPNKSPVNIVGTWRGHTFPDMPKSLKNTGLNDLLMGVKDQLSLNPAHIQKMQNECYKMLVSQTGLSMAKIHQLINFDGLPQDLAELCRQAKLTTGIHGQSAQLDRLRSARIQNYWDSLKNGALGFKSQMAFGYEKPFNLVLDLWTLLVQFMMTGQSTSPTDFDIKTCTVGVSTIAVDSTQTALEHQIAFKAFDTYTLVGYQTTWLTGWLPADGNGFEIDIDAVTDSSHFSVSSVSDISIGDRIIVFGASLDPAGEKTTVTNISGSADLTVSPALSATPTVADVVRTIWYESGLTTAADGSDLISRFLIEDDGGFDKGNNGTVPVGIYTESAITLRIVPD